MIHQSNSNQPTTISLDSGSGIVKLFISSSNSTSERRFDKSISVIELKQRLEPITGGDQD